MATELIKQGPMSVEPHNMLATVMRAAMDPNLDPARLGAFLAMARELEQDQKRQEWAMAFKAAKEELDEISITKRGEIVYKTGVVKFMRYDDIADAVKPALRRHSLAASYTFRYESTPPKAICVMTLTHANGFERTFESIPLPMVDTSGGKNDVQGAGSVMSYGRRYAVCAAFDIVADGEDDDGNAGKFSQRYITEEEAIRIKDILHSCEEREPGFNGRFNKWIMAEFKASSVGELAQGGLKSVMQKLSEKQRALGL